MNEYELYKKIMQEFKEEFYDSESPFGIKQEYLHPPTAVHKANAFLDYALKRMANNELPIPPKHTL